jgi:hypothetical protein
MWEDLLRIDRRNSYGVHTFVAWEEQGSLRAIMVHNCQHGVVVSIRGQICDQIPTDCLEGIGMPSFSGDWVDGDFGSRRIRLSALTHGTSLHVLYDEAFHVRPPIIPCNACVRIENSRVTSAFMIMIHAEDTLP